jgi:septal ring factor EnvC (AmiA/AmiB activator)
VPDELDEIRQRLDRVEGRLNSEIRQRLDSLESRVNSEASLRAMMDLDQVTLTTRFDAQDNLLCALAVTQSEHTSRLGRLEEGHRRLEAAVTRVETGIQTILGLLREGH